MMNSMLRMEVKLNKTWRISLLVFLFSNLLLFLSLKATKNFAFFFKKAETSHEATLKKDKKAHNARKYWQESTKKLAYLPLSNISQNLSLLPLVLMAPTITATQTVAVEGGGSALPEGQLNYTTILSNTASGTGNDATNVVFTNVLSNNLTLVGGSVKASPIAANDAYASIGNVGITVDEAGGILTNDISPDNTSLTVTSVTNATTTNAGSINIAANGSFSYTPAPGFNGSDTYTYTVNSSNGLTGTGTVTFTVSTPIWFINKDYVGGGSDGTLAKPFTTVTAFQANNTGANTNKGENGDYIFVYAGSYTTSAVTLRNNQKLIGQAATSSIVTITGLTVPSFSNLLPTTGGAATTIANTGTTPITLGSDNEIHGITATSTSGITLSGASVGALKIREMSLTATSGQALQITAGGALDVQLVSISAAGGAKGMSVNNSTGSFQVLGTGSTAGSGGTINNITTRGAEFISCANVTLKNMNFTNANTSTTVCSTPGVDNSACNAAIHFKSISTAAALDNISITGTNNAMGININDVTDFSLANSTLTSCGSSFVTGNEGGGIYALNLKGTCSMTNSNINNSNGRNFYCYNGILSSNPTVNLTVTGCQFKNTFGTSNGGSCFSFEGYNSSNNTIVIKNSDFSNANTYGLFMAFGNASVNTVQVGGSTVGEGNTMIASTTSPGSNGFALQGASNLTGTVNYNVLNNTFQSSYNGTDIFNIGSSGNGMMQGRCNLNTATAVNGVNSNGIYVAQYGTGTHKAEILNNVVSGTKNYGIGVESNDNSMASTGRMDATVRDNNISMITDAYAHVSVSAIANAAAGTSLTTCTHVGNNTTNTSANLATGQLDVLAVNTGSSTTQIVLQGATAFTPSTPQPVDQSTTLTSFWNANNVGTRTAFDEQGGGTINSGVCLTPSNPTASLLADNNNEMLLQKQNVVVETTIIKDSLGERTEISSNETDKTPPQYVTDKMPIVTVPTSYDSPQALLLTGETITVNGAGTGFTIPAGKSTTIVFSATIVAVPSSCLISNQGSVAGSNFSTILTDDTNVPGSADPTVASIILPVPITPTISTTNICSGQGLTVSAVSSSGTLKWWTVSSGGTEMATGSSYEPANITANTSYYASRWIGGCESSRILVGSVTINPLTFATTTQNNTSSISGSSAIVLVGTSCNVIGKVQPDGALPISGNTSAVAWYETVQPVNYVRRHIEITPTLNPTTATAIVTLYFRQQDFDDFNAVNAIKLPTSSGDAIGISQLLVEKRGGSSSDASGLPETYSGGHQTINPNDVDIFWNATDNRWEISFSITGFSGFFVKTTSGSLPVELLSFTGKNTESGNLLTWQTASETNNKGFDVEYSSDGQMFTKIGWKEGQRSSSVLTTYAFLDKNSLSDISYYRLKQWDLDEKFTYSDVISLKKNKETKFKVSPNPAGDVLIVVTDQNRELPYSITNMLGQEVKKGIVNAQSTVDISSFKAGTYFIHCNNTLIKFVKNP